MPESSPLFELMYNGIQPTSIVIARSPDLWDDEVISVLDYTINTYVEHFIRLPRSL